MCSNNAALTRPINSIKVRDCIRKDLGDIQDLADSIKLVGGLLQPIIIDSNNNLLAGGRRLAAAKLAGLNEVPVIISEANPKLVKWAENHYRKALTVSERLARANEVAPLILLRDGKNLNNPVVKEAVQVQIEAASAETGITDPAMVNALKPEPAELPKNVVAKLGGFGSRDELECAEAVVATGDLALIAKVDAGVISLPAGATEAKKMQANKAGLPVSK